MELFEGGGYNPVAVAAATDAALSGGGGGGGCVGDDDGRGIDMQSAGRPGITDEVPNGNVAVDVANVKNTRQIN